MIRASQVVPMPPRQFPLTLPPKYLSPSLVARSTRLELPSRNTFSRLSRYCPQNSGLSNPTGFLIGVRFDDTVHFDGSGAEPAAAVELVMEQEAAAFGHRAPARWAVELDSPVHEAPG